MKYLGETFNRTQFPNKTCSVQLSEEFWPWGPSRPGFITAFQEILEHAIFIRENKNCDTSQPGPGLAKYIVDYLLVLGFDYYIDPQVTTE